MNQSGESQPRSGLKKLEASLPELLALGWAPSRMSQDPLVLQTYSQDLWPRKLLELRQNGPGPAVVDLVLWPQSSAEVAQAVKWVHRVDAILIPYGAGSGVCGGTIPSDTTARPRVIIDLKRMKRVLEIDRKTMTVAAEAGIIGENLERALNQEGFTLGHFPSSIYCSSLGGYLASRSAGQLSTKYGKIEDMVLSLEVVLPGREILEPGRAPRSAVGPDWTQLLLGSEGTLCIFTSAKLQIHPLPEERIFQGYEAKDALSALEFSRCLMQKGIRPAVLRIYDPLETSLALNSEALKKAGFNTGAAMVIVFEGPKGLTEVEAKLAEAMARTMEIRPLDSSLGARWWEHRYAVSYKQQLILSHGRTLLDTFEIAATWDRIGGVYTAVKGVSVGLGMIMAHMSHFYHTGANIYFTLVGHSGLKEDTVTQYDQIWEKMLEAAHLAGATLSHHHGVGNQKNEWMRKERRHWVPIFERVKRGFDPENRFNPGKMGL